MTKSADRINIIDVTTDNVDEVGIYCIKNKKSPGYNKKVEWFKNKINNGLRIKIATDKQGKQLGFIEFIPSEIAWRPINAQNYYFIQCIGLFVKKAKNKKIGSTLVLQCEQEARQNKKSGICTMTSDGPWIANKTLFEKNGFVIADRLGRFELMHKRLNDRGSSPRLNDWTKEQEKYKGWNLIYADQCPWHQKSITDIKRSAAEHAIKLKVFKLTTPEDAQNAPSGFGTYALIKDGRLLEDHVISRTRFENILRQENEG
jgi:GNAT superfamily N-acetyltransferase